MSHVFYTDGSSSMKSGKCGWAVIGRFNCFMCLPGVQMNPNCQICGGLGVREIRRCGFGNGTNQLAELVALVYAMRLAPNAPTLIISDSEYSIDAVTTNRRRWEISKYLSVTGKPISYPELIKYAHRLHDEKPLISFRHVRGHTGVEGNELADALSRSARYVAEGREPIENLADMLVKEF